MVVKEVRSFIAIELSQDVKTALFELQNSLKIPKYNFIKWVAYQGIHVTLKFLGNVEILKINEIIESIKIGCMGQKPFKIEISNLGVFPNYKKPSIIWIGIIDEFGELFKLQQKIEHELSLLGFTEEKRSFSPHITLARIGTSAMPQENINYSTMLQRYSYDEKLHMLVNSVSFIKSQLLPSGAVYSKLAELNLES